jgi:membrane dipeptidase
MKNFLLIVSIFILFYNFTCEQLPRSAGNNKDTGIIKDSIKQINSMDSVQTEINAFKLHYDAIVIDTHNDILMPVFLKGAVITKDNLSTQSDIVKWQKGGVDAQVFSIYVPERFKSDHFGYAMKMIDFVEKMTDTYPELMVLCYNYDDLLKNLERGIFCILMGAEGGSIIEGSIDNLITLYNRGVRYLGLTWNTSNQIGTSARDESQRGRKGGLTEFGKEVVITMDSLGMMIDVSHLGETAFWNVTELSKNPVIASHSSVYSLCPHYRNLTDEQIKAIAKSGGYIGVNFHCEFIAPSANKSQVNAIHNKYKNALKQISEVYADDLIKFNEERYNYLTENKSDNGTSIDILIDHIDYIVKLVGVDYVGFGSDFDGGVYTPNEMYDATCYPVITKKLVERGYKDEDIRKILGGNFLRVFKQVCK